MNALALLLRWALLVIGVIYFITESAIFALVRIRIARLGTLPAVLIYCASCTGFWVGLALASWTWPYNIVGVPAWAQVLEGGVAAMALGALWSIWKGGNPAWDAEAPLHDHQEPTETRPSRDEETDRAQG